MNSAREMSKLLSVKNFELLDSRRKVGQIVNTFYFDLIASLVVKLLTLGLLYALWYLHRDTLGRLTILVKLLITVHIIVGWDHSKRLLGAYRARKS